MSRTKLLDIVLLFENVVWEITPPDMYVWSSFFSS